MKVKVRTDRLIELIEARKRREHAEYELARDAHPEQLALYRERVATALAKACDRARAGGRLPQTSSHYRDGQYVPTVLIETGAAAPTKPRKPNHAALNARIRELRLETREELLVDVRDREWVNVL